MKKRTDIVEFSRVTPPRKCDTCALADKDLLAQIAKAGAILRSKTTRMTRAGAWRFLRDEWGYSLGRWAFQTHIERCLPRA